MKDIAALVLIVVAVFFAAYEVTDDSARIAPLKAQCAQNQGVWLDDHMWSDGGCYARELLDPKKRLAFERQVRLDRYCYEVSRKTSYADFDYFMCPNLIRNDARVGP